MIFNSTARNMWFVRIFEPPETKNQVLHTSRPLFDNWLKRAPLVLQPANRHHAIRIDRNILAVCGQASDKQDAVPSRL